MHTLNDEIFTVIFFGKTGAGKSTTLNKLFGLELAPKNRIPSFLFNAEAQRTQRGWNVE
jgi:predicted GTPase